MIVLILLRIGPNKLSLSARQAPAQLGQRPRKPVPGTGNKDSGTRRQRQDATEQDPRPGNDVASPETAGLRRSRRPGTAARQPPGCRWPQRPQPTEVSGGPGRGDPPFGQNPHRSQARREPGRAAAARALHISTPPPEPLQGRGGGLSTAPGAFTTGWKLNTWMEVERLFVEKFHQSFSLDN
uniref:Uncharacterized protein n=1 Tax=Cercocebus atys TaxID=9531 RepID=A0A2K5LK80_CERAT